MLSAMSNTEPLFVPEQLYHRRRDIHARFGGQEQGGMITPANHKLIFLVTQPFEIGKSSRMTAHTNEPTN